MSYDLHDNIQVSTLLGLKGHRFLEPEKLQGPTIEELFRGINVIRNEGNLKLPVTHLITDSRRVIPGSLFFALRGTRTDGRNYVEEAVGRGAIGVVSDIQEVCSQKSVTLITVPDIRKALAQVAAHYYGHPQKDLVITGVTGTNGKTTVTTTAQGLLSEPGKPVGLVGTIHYDLGGRTLPSFRTTPEAVDNYCLLAQMRDYGCTDAIMEMSSHGIDQQRILGLEPKIAVFLNLSQDHMDYHGSMEEYFNAKCRLFTGELGFLPETIIINRDDPYGCRLLKKLPQGPGVLTFGQSPRADFRADRLGLDRNGTHFTLHYPGGELELSSPMLGHYNVSNLLAALSIAHARGRSIPEVCKKIATLTPIPGRMQKIDCGQPFDVFVDYAHTPQALRQVLSMLSSIHPGRLLVVFGCGGNRDQDKRALMTRIVQEWADFAWATADNPRRELLAKIFEAMKDGVLHPHHIAFVDDRRRAIDLALQSARPGDCVLIAGKGHEAFQEFSDVILPFDDRQVVQELLRIRG